MRCQHRMLVIKSQLVPHFINAKDFTAADDEISQNQLKVNSGANLRSYLDWTKYEPQNQG